MGLDFELKISPTRDDDPSSTFQLQLAKSTATPSFWSNETNSMFILTAKLTAINGSGTRIEISSGYPVQKMEITRWTYKKETEARRLMKIFRIPDGVVLDEITATYDEESILMPKSVDGILGVGIEEVKEQEVDEEAFVSQDYEAEEIPRTTAELETLETARKTKVVEDNHGNEEDDTINGEVEEENAEHGAYPKIEYVEKEATRENVNGEIKVPKVRSMEGIEVDSQIDRLEENQGSRKHIKVFGN